MKKILKFLPVVALIASVFAMTTTNTNSVNADAAGPYRILGAFNDWNTSTNTKNLSTSTTKIGNSLVYYGKHTIYGEWKMLNASGGWLGQGKLTDQARGTGFSGTDNIVSPDTIAPGSVYSFFVDSATDNITVIKNVYLAGSINDWTTNNPSYTFNQNEAQPWYFDLTVDLPAAAQFKITFGSWTGALGAANLTNDSKNLYGFAGTDNITMTTAPAGEYTITLDILNFLIDIVPADDSATAVAESIMAYDGGDLITTECATKYQTIKARILELNATQLHLFKNSEDPEIAQARARYTQWAYANRDFDGMYSSNTDANRGYSASNNNDLTLVIMMMSLLGLTALGGFYFLTAKKSEK